METDYVDNTEEVWKGFLRLVRDNLDENVKPLF
jgi:hypothetical protein